MSLILQQPPDVTHINKVYYTLYGNVTSDATVTRRLGYQLFNVDTGEEITPVRSFDPLGQNGFHRIQFQRNVRTEVTPMWPLLTLSLQHVHYARGTVTVRLDTSIIEINNASCLREIIPEQTGREIVVVNGVLGFDEEEFERIGEELSILTNKFPLLENHYTKCPNERDFVYVHATVDTVYSTRYIIPDKIVGGAVIPGETINETMNISAGVTAIDLDPYVHGLSADGENFRLSIGNTHIYVHLDECACEEENIPLYAWHPYGGFDNLNMLFVDSDQVDVQNEVIRIADTQGQQTEFRNYQGGFTTINHVSKEQKVWTRRMPNTIENKRWAKYIMSAKLFGAVVKLQRTEDIAFRLVVVSSATYTVSKRNDEIIMEIIGFFNQPIEVQ